MNEIHTGTVSNLSSDGQGIIRSDGFVVFVPFTASGDTVSYQIEKKKKNFGFGKLLEVIHPSQGRTLPRCPYFGTCGGCEIQHLIYSEQLKVKRQWVEDALQRIGKMIDIHVPEVIPANLQWGYRRRINLLLRQINGIYSAGYTATDHTSFLKVSECPIFTTLENSDSNVILTLQKIVSGLKPAGNSELKNDARAMLLKTSNGKYILHFDFLELPENLKDFDFKEFDYLFQSISFSSPKKNLSFGQNAELSMDIEGLKINFSAKAFIQAHPEQSLKIYQAIEELAKSVKPKKVLDLYCGIGISSLLIARQASDTIVTGIEFNKQAIDLAQKNAEANHLNNTKFIASTVEDVLDKYLGEKNLNEKPDFVIVNPPREGLSSVVLDSLCQRKVKTLVYISCMPSTLSRDLKRLTDSGYAISHLQPYDMFPQTRHIETLVVLKS